MEAETPQLHGILPAPALSLTALKVKKMPKRPEIKRMPTPKGSSSFHGEGQAQGGSDGGIEDIAQAVAKATAPRATATKSKPKPASGSNFSEPGGRVGETWYRPHRQCRRSWLC